MKNGPFKNDFYLKLVIINFFKQIYMAIVLFQTCVLVMITSHIKLYCECLCPLQLIFQREGEKSSCFKFVVEAKYSSAATQAHVSQAEKGFGRLKMVRLSWRRLTLSEVGMGLASANQCLSFRVSVYFILE